MIQALSRVEVHFARATVLRERCRPAVIARKVSHCSKLNVGGADAFSAFTSVIRTLARNGERSTRWSTGSAATVQRVAQAVPTPSF